jgi:uncharacterized membrane protein YesL
MLALLSFVWWVCMLFVIPGPPATAGLYLVANRLAKGERAGFDIFKEGFLTYFWRSLLVGLITAALLFLFVTGFLFYLDPPPQFPAFFTLLSVVMLYLLLTWLAMQLYLFPVLVEQDVPLKLIFRNALFIAFASPVYTLILMVLLVACTVASVLFPILLVLVLPGLAAVVCSIALQDRLANIRARTPQPPTP